MTIRLTMSFINEAERTTSYTIDDPKEGITEAEVQAVMEDMISRNIFNTSGGDLKSIASARVTTTSVNQLI
jgi:hypothetical protein